MIMLRINKPYPVTLKLLLRPHWLAKLLINLLNYTNLLTFGSGNSIDLPGEKLAYSHIYLLAWLLSVKSWSTTTRLFSSGQTLVYSLTTGSICLPFATGRAYVSTRQGAWRFVDGAWRYWTWFASSAWIAVLLKTRDCHLSPKSVRWLICPFCVLISISGHFRGDLFQTQFQMFSRHPWRTKPLRLSLEFVSCTL